MLLWNQQIGKGVCVAPAIIVIISVAYWSSIWRDENQMPLGSSATAAAISGIFPRGKTTSLFVGEIEKELSRIKKIRDCLRCQTLESVKVFCSKYPGRHGCSSYVMTAVRLFKKPGYVRFTASVLRKYHNVDEQDIHLFDDCSDNLNRTALRQWYGKKVKYFRSNTKTGIDATTKRIFEHFINSKYSILLLLDSDMILLKGWLNFIEDHIVDTDGILSLYHPSVNHSYAFDCDSKQGDLCVGNSMVREGAAMTKPLVRAILSNRGSFNLEVVLEKSLDSDLVRFFYPEKSLVMRIGQRNQDDENCGENEVAYRFNRCEYPSWIRDQIEFYFDRCTSPDEIYPDDPESEEFREKLQKRFWVRPAISYSFYGSLTRYLAIAMANAVSVSRMYPGWKMWVFYDNSVPDPYLQEFCEYDVRMIDMTNSKIVNKMSWRFLAASEPVKRFVVRDIDSFLLPRRKAVVEEWISSGKKFHIIRDHPKHSKHPIMGGIWGGTYDAFPSMRQALENHTIGTEYMEDMTFLSEVIWPVAQNSVWTNDAFSIHKFGEDHPFPPNSEGLGESNIILHH